MGDQQSSILRTYDSENGLTKDEIDFVLGVIIDRTKQENSPPGQLFANVKGLKNGIMTGANVPQTVLVLDSGATIHFFSNENMMKDIHNGPEPLRIHCGGKSWDQYAVGELCDDLKHLSLPQGPMYIAKDGIGNLLSLGQLAKHY